jgi:hypothetical protein
MDAVDQFLFTCRRSHTTALRFGRNGDRDRERQTANVG